MLKEDIVEHVDYNNTTFSCRRRTVSSVIIAFISIQIIQVSNENGWLGLPTELDSVVVDDMSVVVVNQCVAVINTTTIISHTQLSYTLNYITFSWQKFLANSYEEYSSEQY